MAGTAGDYLCENDKENMAYWTKVSTGMLHATAAARDVLTIRRYAHLIGGARPSPAGRRR